MVCSALCSDQMNTAPRPRTPPPAVPPPTPSPGTVPSALGVGEVLPSEDSAELGVVLRDFAGPEWVVWVCLHNPHTQLRVEGVASGALSHLGLPTRSRTGG